MQLKNSEKPNIKEYKTLNIEDIKENKDINTSDDNQIKIEISVLTKPELVEADSYKDYLAELQVGREGLIIDNAHHRGLLLPQVPVEQNWNLETYLENLCYKAGLDKDDWKDENTKIYSFQALVFNEK